MKKLEKIHKEYQRLGPAESSMIRKTNFSIVSKTWEKFEINKTIIFNVLFLPRNGGLEKIRQACI